MSKVIKKWSDEEVSLIRSAIKNHAEDVEFLMKALNRSRGSIICRLGRERIHYGLSPKGYTGETIGYNPRHPITL